MGVFDDKKFEELDWISQATEPIDSELNEVLGILPDEVIINFELYTKIIDNHYNFNLSVDDVVSYFLRKQTIGNISWQSKRILMPCFELQVSENCILDFETKTITGEIKLIKVQSTMDEKVLEGMLGREGIDQVAFMRFSGPGIGRANEIMEILGKCELGLRSRSERKKRSVIKIRLCEIFKGNEWKIKDTTLANKVGSWICSYICDGELAALGNFARLKVMTHKGDPIYSMEELT